MKDYAKCMRDLVDIHYPNAETIRIVQALRGAMYQTFPPAEARRILRADRAPLHPQARKLATQHG
ncbi:hypothetical protein [Bradyrhizobium sp. sBnM-33]|uniref:hypothetical protein n=1 Tax=Bradyrhizobium sp. sBnM-33 TaxID=2831780 RepID=UPI001BCD3AAC